MSPIAYNRHFKNLKTAWGIYLKEVTTFTNLNAMLLKHFITYKHVLNVILTLRQTHKDDEIILRI